MKPASIRRFDLFFLASLALLVIGFILSFDTTVASMEAQTAAKGLHVGAGFAVAILALVLAIDLLLWFFVSRRASAIAKWFLVVLLVLDLLGIPSLVSAGMTTSALISLLRIAAEAVAIVFLFRPDAAAWFARRGDGNVDQPDQTG